MAGMLDQAWQATITELKISFLEENLPQSCRTVCVVIVRETPATRLRSKTIGLGRVYYAIVSVVNYVAASYLLNQSEGNWKEKTEIW